MLMKTILKIENCLINPSSTDKNVEIVRSDIMIGVRTPIPLFYVCEFMMVLSSLLSKKNQ